MDPVERDELAETLLVTSRALVAIAVRSMAAGVAGVTVVQHRVLVLLDDRGPLSVNALAEELGVDQSNASRHCARLAGLGLVTRARSRHDGRGVDTAITEAGRRHLEAVRRARRTEIGRVLDRMPDDAARAAVRAFELFDRTAAGAPHAVIAATSTSPPASPGPSSGPSSGPSPVPARSTGQ